MERYYRARVSRRRGDGEVAGEQLDLGALSEAAKIVQTVDNSTQSSGAFWRLIHRWAGPKAATGCAGMPWIARFAAKDDTYPVCRTELGVMRLALEVGLDVPPTVFTTLLGNDIYLIERFDRRIAGNQLRRIPYASAMTMFEALELAADLAVFR